MKNISSYLHVMDGRLRIKVPAIKRSVQKARQVEDFIRSFEGIIRVTANPTTANVLVFFHSHLVTPQAIIEGLRQAHYLRRTTAVPSPRVTERVAGGLVDTVSQVMARSLAEAFTEAVMERALLAWL